MPETSESLLGIVNSSGFPFQISVTQLIRQTQHQREEKWGVVATEHAWKHPLSDAEGFIDIVLLSGMGRMVVECKRTTDAHWIFLVPDGRLSMSRSRLLWTHAPEGGPSAFDWHDFTIVPASPEASFCTLRGQGAFDQPMLERLSNILLASTEALASQEITLGPHKAFGPARIYFPTIVTNATLQVCKFDPSTVDLSTGQLPNAEFQDVPFVRFRKPLLSAFEPKSRPTTITEINTLEDRTVFVASAASLPGILRESRISKGAFNDERFPWEQN